MLKADLKTGGEQCVGVQRGSFALLSSALLTQWSQVWVGEAILEGPHRVNLSLGGFLSWELTLVDAEEQCC